MKNVTIYTDGGCSGNPGPGGWGAVLIYGEVEKDMSGSAPETTNNRMELTAAIEALKALRNPCNVDLYTDSQYLRKGITEWIAGWQKRGWKTAAKKPVKNQDLWQNLLKAVEPHKIEWHWVKGHSDDTYNERADQLATLAIPKD